MTVLKFCLKTYLYIDLQEMQIKKSSSHPWSADKLSVISSIERELKNRNLNLIK